jgi:ubiquinone/menaquinone biosynthesis C-methylase UbiE
MKKYNQCYDVSRKNKRYLNISIKRSKGHLPDMEVAKAYAKIINKIVKKEVSILDVGCLTGHFNRTFGKLLKKKYFYTGIDPWQIHINAAKKIWKKSKNSKFKLGWAQKIPFENSNFDVVICSNVLTHIPEIKKPLSEMIRTTKKYLILRTPVHEKSYRIQLVLNSKWFKFTNVKPKDEFDKKGNPRVYEYYDVHSFDYLKATLKKIAPNCKIKFIKDTFFSKKNIENNKEKKHNKTTVINGQQVSDLLILPHYFVIVEV